MNVEFAVPFSLITPMGTLDFNADDGRGLDFRYMIEGTKSLIGPAPLRTTLDDVPQGDGGLPHRSFRAYTLAKLYVHFWKGEDNESAKPACGADARDMWDYLLLHLNSLVRVDPLVADVGDSQLIWTPTSETSMGLDDRMLNRVTLYVWPVPIIDESGFVDVEFTLMSPFPYAMNKTERSTPLSAVNAVVTNEGNSDFFPVFRINGPADTFDVFHVESGLGIFYDDSFPGGIALGGGDYAEIDVFKNTIFLNGNSSNLKAGLNYPLTDFFSILPGVNTVHIGGDALTGEMLWQPAWV